jgi:drug/metabolite transporter (DMT)-like permease
METIERSDIHRQVGLATGALFLSASAVLLGVAESTPATATVARSLLALPVIAALGYGESRRNGRLGVREWVSAAVCGLLFACDMLWWTQAIPEVGAGLSTVLVNTQVVIVPLLAWLFDRERSGPRFVLSLPVILIGVLLAGGVFEHGVTGTDPVWVVLASAAAVSAVVGLATGSLDLTPGWASFGWLLLVTITGQLVGWLLVALCGPGLPSDISSALLLLTPVGAVALGALVLHERPSPLQLAGCALVLVASYWGTSRR